MTDLATRLEQAPEGSRELSDEVLRAMGFTQPIPEMPGVWHWPESMWAKVDNDMVSGTFGPRRSNRPDPTRSVDDALSLVPEGWGLEQICFTDKREGDHWKDGVPVLVTAGNYGQGPEYRSADAIGKNLPLALCAALVKMKEKERHD